MARTTPRSRILGALMLPVLAAVGLSSASCSSSSEEDRNTSIQDVKKIVYAVRQHTVVNGQDVQINVAGGMGQVFEYLRYVPGARLEVKDLATGGVENIIEDFPKADIANLDVSFDATKVVFSMKQNGDDAYHIYWSSLTRGDNGKFDIHQLTFGSADDIDPVYLAGDKVAFVTNEGYTEMGTRADEYNHSRQATQIATITLQGGDADRKLCSQNLSNSFNLFSMADGKVGFSRWEHLGPTNDMKTFAMNPDCTQMVAIGGQHGKPGNSLFELSETNTPNVFLGIITDRKGTIQAGTMVRMDARSPVDSSRFFEEDVKFDMLTPAVPTGREPSPVGRYRNPTSLPDGRMRPATADDRPRLNAWADSFAEHAGTDDPRAGADVIEGVLRDGEIYLWEDDGPRSMAAWVRPTRNGASISLVYTPPEHRGRGYASGLVAGISQALLDRGRRFTTLFTDQKNPTSNKIYARIGYQAICDWRDLWFVERAGR